MPKTLELLQQRFEQFWQDHGFQGNANEAWQEIIGHYGETQRGYHNLRHIHALLNQFDEIKDKLAQPAEVEAALWYHDIIYDSAPAESGKPPQDNEERSARLACARAQGSTLDIGALEALILATKHTQPPATKDQAYMIDIDLSVFGQSQRSYKLYEEGIRREYAWRDREAHLLRRVQVLSGFLSREPIYQTDYFHDKFEAKARHNLTQAIADLRRPQQALFDVH